MNKQGKPFLTAHEQILHLLSKGVSFEILEQAAAEKYLQNNNNYFKLRAFRKNYERIANGPNAGKYIGLDFAMLCDLATIDMHMRYTILQIALNNEHFLKVKLLRKMEVNGEDGYAVVTDFFNHLQSEDRKRNTHHYTQLTDELKRNQGNPYCGGLISACSDGYSVWAFIEVISLGMLLRFYKFCADRFGDRDMINDFYLMQSVRELRNASAHNNCIINDLQSANRMFIPDKKMMVKLSSIRRDTLQKRLSNARILQICTLLYMHTKLGTDSANKHVRDLLQSLIERMKRNKEYYKSNTIILGNYQFFIKLVDIFFSKY